MRSKLLQLTLMILAGLLFSCTEWSDEGKLPVVPKPLREAGSYEQIAISNNWKVYIPEAFQPDSDYLSSIFSDWGIEINRSDKADANVIVKIDNRQNQNPEAYSLRVQRSGKVTISSSTERGMLYAFQTLRQLIESGDEGLTLPECRIEDEPTFSWRAYLLDEARHFQGMETVKQMLDEMARLKMNLFHWHLVDDPGWRIEINKWPELTAVGSKRNFTDRELTLEEFEEKYPDTRMYYTQDEIKEIITYAANRGISIMPEIEVPGHASAAVAAYPWLGSSSSREGKGIWGDLFNVTDPETEQLLRDVLDEVIELFPLKIIHIGGDEANYAHWQNNPEIVEFMESNNIPTFADLQVWSINRFSNYLDSKGVRMMGWNEITGDNIRQVEHIEAGQSEQLAQGTIVHFWDGDITLVNKAIDKGHDVVNSNRHFTYLDYPYEVIPLQMAYSFNPIPDGLDSSLESKILGTGCQMWGEFTPTKERVYIQTFPRIAAYAECGWTKASEKDFDQFCKRIKKIEKSWSDMGYLIGQPTYSSQAED